LFGGVEAGMVPIPRAEGDGDCDGAVTSFGDETLVLSAWLTTPR
jgi:hypothetical protein